MEPEGRPLTPGTSYGPLDFNSAQSPSPTASAFDHDSSAAQPSRSPNSGDGPPSARRSWGEPGEGLEPGGSAQRRARSSAFPSSLSWDSDSEKETLDEDELLQLCNPHGLAAHSPGSPSAALRLECEDSQEPEQEQELTVPAETDVSSQEEGRQNNTESTTTQQPNPPPLGPGQPADSAVWNVSEASEPFISISKPKEGCQAAEEEAEEEGSKTHMGKEFKEAERDVYSFPGDSDPESPPPAPWAHCTFIQRCRRKRVLLRPFSGLGSRKHTSAESARNSKDSESERVYDFDEDEMLEAEPKEQVEESSSEMGDQIYTCVECSIYFKKQIHLQEHMVEHSQSTSEGCEDEESAKSNQFKCVECGWNLPNESELVEHQRRHQESRDKILTEIEKLNDKETDLKKQDSNEALKLLTPLTIPITDCAIVDLEALDRTPVQGRGQTGYRRRFVCPVCNFSTRTPQALSNHAKTHNRKPASSQLACLYCAFRTTSKKTLREHLKCAHHGREENGQRSKGILDSEISGKIHRGAGDSEESEMPDGSQVFRRFSRRERSWTPVGKYNVRSQYDKLCGSEDGMEVQSLGLDSDLSQQGVKSARSASNSVLLADDSLAPRSSTRTLPVRRSTRHEDRQDARGKVMFLRRSSRVSALTVGAASGGDDDDDEEEEGDEERARRLLSDEDVEEIDDDDDDDDAEALKGVERKCPYCPDRFHNGIGLANHVRGHLNRVGVSYNVRHFISPEEVNAIERRFSYQKKKKKVANFDPATFSVMRCEFCNAGFDTRAGLSSHARAHLRDLGITNWDVTVSPIHILREAFSSRPDLVIPTAPPRSPYEDEDDEEDERGEEEEEIIEVKLENDLGERIETTEAEKCWKFEDEIKECKDEEEEAADAEEDGDAQRLGAPSHVPLKPGLLQDADGSPPEDARAKADHLKCEVCGAQFETRRGLSSHARSHLRQLGIRGSESSGAPINFLYQIAKQRNLDGQIRPPPLQGPAPDRPPAPSASHKDEGLEVMDVDEKPIPPSILAKAAKAVPPPSPSRSTPSPGASPGASPAPARCLSPSAVVRKAPISSLLPVSSPLRSLEHKAGGMKGLASTLSSTKPLWAPQENDAPLNLTLEVDPNKDIVCQLCGAWFETRKGLSSHARAHLRHFGVEYSESKGSPIDLLNQLIKSDDFKHKARALQLDGPPETRGLGAALFSPKQPLLPLSASSSPLLYKVTTSAGGATSKSTSASPLLGPPSTKRLKPSSMQVFRLSSGELMALPHSEPLKEIGCEFCGEYFENRKGLSSHARSHLRQMGITQWTVNGSPIDTLREIIARRGLPSALPLRPLQSPPPPPPPPASSPPVPPRSPVSTSSSPPGAPLGRLPFAFARRPSPPHVVVSRLSSVPPSSLSGLVLKPKAEPVQVEVTGPGTKGFSPGGLSPTWTSSNSVHPLNFAMAHDMEPARDIRCEFCGEYFENRKGLSSHARSHLRQMGITQWTVNGSPIDTLREVMRKRGLGASASSSELEVKKEPDVEGSSASWERAARSLDTTSSYQSPSLRKSPLSLLQSGLRIHKPGLSTLGSSAVPSGGRFFRMSPLGKRPLSEDTAHSPAGYLKAYSPLPHDLSFKSKSPPVRHRPDPSCELCGFYFENRKALASHARAHLRQFGVTEWSVNGSPIETLSAWIRSRPQKVLDMHRSYMQGNRSPLKKKCRSPVSVSADSHHVLPASSPKAASSSSSSSASHWSSSLAVSLVRPINREVAHCSSKTSEEDESGGRLDAAPLRPGRISPGPARLSGSLPLQAQVARSELNVRLPRGFERRPLKHPSCPDGAERDSSSPRPPRTGTGTVPALVPKPPSYPLVKLEGNFYTLKCRFCEVEFHGPLSVQEDWIRHLQQHILKMNYKKPAAPKAAAGAHSDPLASADTSAPVQTSASTSTSSDCTTTPALTSGHAPTLPAKCAPTNTAAELDHIAAEQPAVTPTPV